MLEHLMPQSKCRVCEMNAKGAKEEQVERDKPAKDAH
jgi:hypothetical protein